MYAHGYHIPYYNTRIRSRTPLPSFINVNGKHLTPKYCSIVHHVALSLPHLNFWRFSYVCRWDFWNEQCEWAQVSHSLLIFKKVWGVSYTYLCVCVCGGVWNWCANKCTWYYVVTSLLESMFAYRAGVGTTRVLSLMLKLPLT